MEIETPMPMSEPSVKALRKCYLVRPRRDRARGMMMLQHGAAKAIDDQVPRDVAGPVIYFEKAHQESVTGLLRELEIELKKSRLTGASIELAEAVLALCISCRETDNQPSLDDIVQSSAEISATLYLGIPFMTLILTPRGEDLLPEFRIGRFHIGMSTLAEHKHRFPPEPAEHNDSPLTTIGRPAGWLRRDPVDCRILNAALDSTIAGKFRDTYLTIVGNHLAMVAKGELDDDQTVPVALGGSPFDVDKLFSLHGLRVDVAFGDRACTSGYVMNYGSDILPVDPLSLRRTGAALRKQLDPRRLGECPGIDNLLSAYSRFLLKARIHENGGRASDAFIHCVFALDLALGGDQETTKTISRRAAAIHSACSGVPFLEAEKAMKEIYRMRSKYVHAGVTVRALDTSTLSTICKEVTESLLRVRLQDDAVESNFATAVWHPRLDLLAAAMRVNAKINPENYEKCGLTPPKNS